MCIQNKFKIKGKLFSLFCAFYTKNSYRHTHTPNIYINLDAAACLEKVGQPKIYIVIYETDIFGYQTRINKHCMIFFFCLCCTNYRQKREKDQGACIVHHVIFFNVILHIYSRFLIL